MLYEFQCDDAKCSQYKKIVTKILSLRQRKDPQHCKKCGERLRRLLSTFQRHESWSRW